MHYRQLPEAIWSTLTDHFDVFFTAEEVERMRMVTQFDVKHAGLAFEQDSATKQQLATGEIRDLAERFVMPWYDRLEALSNTIGVPYVEKL